MEKSDFFLIAKAMKESELHPDVIEVLDVIASLLPGSSTTDSDPSAALDS